MQETFIISTYSATYLENHSLRYSAPPNNRLTACGCRPRRLIFVWPFASPPFSDTIHHNFDPIARDTGQSDQTVIICRNKALLFTAHQM